MNFPHSLSEFFFRQLECWNLAKSNFNDLSRVEFRNFEFSDFSVRVQYNPARIRSTAAKVDSKTIAKRKCFLCECNRPEEQLIFDEIKDFDVLVNPFPIFPIHFTISNKTHCHQDCADFNQMAEFAINHPEMIVFYNASKSGASAPDHLHFQAGNKDFLPICDYVKTHSTRDIKIYESGVSIAAYSDTPMPFFYIVSAPTTDLNHVINKLSGKNDIECSFRNLLMWFEAEKLHTLIFPRKKHRPDCFYAENADQLMVSPGAVDMAGVIILPRKEDFEKITAEDIIRIYREVSADKNILKQQLKEICL